jgi:uncharacterized integral membrane protein
MSEAKRMPVDVLALGGALLAFGLSRELLGVIAIAYQGYIRDMGFTYPGIVFVQEHVGIIPPFVAGVALGRLGKKEPGRWSYWIEGALVLLSMKLVPMMPWTRRVDFEFLNGTLARPGVLILLVSTGVGIFIGLIWHQIAKMRQAT